MALKSAWGVTEDGVTEDEAKGLSASTLEALILTPPFSGEGEEVLSPKRANAVSSDFSLSDTPMMKLALGLKECAEESTGALGSVSSTSNGGLLFMADRLAMEN